MVGAKAGGFFPESLNWFGVEAELFNTTPHIEQQGAAAGSHMRVTTLTINAIARAQFACEKKHLDTEQVTERFAFHYVTEFCRLQPYAGVGLGIYWVDISNSTFAAHANFVPGFNALTGVRYYHTDRIAMFTEYNIIELHSTSLASKDSPDSRASTASIKLWEGFLIIINAGCRGKNFALHRMIVIGPQQCATHVNLEIMRAELMWLSAERS